MEVVGLGERLVGRARQDEALRLQAGRAGDAAKPDPWQIAQVQQRAAGGAGALVLVAMRGGDAAVADPAQAGLGVQPVERAALAEVFGSDAHAHSSWRWFSGS